LTAEEGINATTHQRIFVAKPNGIEPEQTELMLINLNSGKLPVDKNETIALIQNFVPAFRAENSIKENGSKTL